jgi:hypothetical protein
VRITPDIYAAPTNGRRRPSATAAASATQLRRPRPFDPSRKPSNYRAAIRTSESLEEAAAKQEKSNAGHHAILVSLHTQLSKAGWTELNEIWGAVDLSGAPPGTDPPVLFEAKTLSGKNESTQVRSGLAQLFEYRFLGGHDGHELCLVTDGPIDPRRARLLRALEIEWVWVDKKGLHTEGAALLSSLTPLIGRSS